jgi:4-hydroxythreonine-4-phosphate dehydrogenase
MKPLIGITLGDYNGIGIEVTLKALLSPEVHRCCLPVLVGSLEVYEWYARRLKLKLTFREIDQRPFASERDIVPVFPIRRYHVPRIRPGLLTKEAGAYAAEAIRWCTELCLNGIVDGLVTAPVSKKGMEMAGYKYPGQTEMLSQLTDSRQVMMMLLADKFRVGLATVHIPIKDVPRTISIKKILEKLLVIQTSLKRDFRIARPKVAVLGLNPHAGENGMLGSEEKRIIAPALQIARRRKNIAIDGPFPADGFFGSRMHLQYDAILAMYHDQGLIPLKLAGFEKGVNYSAGLKIVRTSPDHGTGFDIAGTGNANPQSMIEAIKLASSISINRKRNIAD